MCIAGMAGTFTAAYSALAQQAESGGTSVSSRESGYVPGCTTEERDINPDCVREGSGQAAPSPRETAPVDLTGYWVSIVSEEWRWRMMTPPKGDFASLPLNSAAQKVANEWDPANPQTCKAFGAVGMIRNPMRVRFSWQGDEVLRMETDHGQVTRDFHFNAANLTGGEPSMQGESRARWEGGALKVVTTRLAPGFLRKNGVPYSEKAVLTEYFDRHSSFGQDYITVLTVVNDPVYLTREMIITTDFKRLADGSAWNPTPCDAPLVLPAAAR